MRAPPRSGDHEPVVRALFPESRRVARQPSSMRCRPKARYALAGGELMSDGASGGARRAGGAAAEDPACGERGLPMRLRAETLPELYETKAEPRIPLDAPLRIHLGQ